MSRFTTNFAAAVVAIMITATSLTMVTSVPNNPQLAGAAVTLLA